MQIHAPLRLLALTIQSQSVATRPCFLGGNSIVASALDSHQPTLVDPAHAGLLASWTAVDAFIFHTFCGAMMLAHD
jgi:hypothetical protein